MPVQDTGRRERLRDVIGPSRKESMAAYGRRAQMLDAAAELFSTRGYHGTSIRDIAAATGILPGSLYAHIRSKEDLLYDIVVRAAEQFLTGVRIVVAWPGSPEEKLRKAMRSHIGVVAHAREEARVFLEEWNALEEPRRAEVRALRDEYESLWDELIREGIEGGRLRQIDPTLARLLVLSAANWTYTWYDPEGPLSPDEIADRFTELLLRGLAADDETGVKR
jgi:AcrR family transcriptional regulator